MGKEVFVEVVDVCFCCFLVFNEEGFIIDCCKMLREGDRLVNGGLGEIFSWPLLVEVVILKFLHIVILGDGVNVFFLLQF